MVRSHNLSVGYTALEVQLPTHRGRLNSRPAKCTGPGACSWPLDRIPSPRNLFIFGGPVALPIWHSIGRSFRKLSNPWTTKDPVEKRGLAARAVTATQFDGGGPAFGNYACA